MELNINVDETKFKDVLENELNAFTKEELHEIIRDGLVKCMSDVNTFKSMFVEKSSGYYSRDEYKATDLLKKAAEKVDFSPIFKDFNDKVIEYINTNAQTIIFDLLRDVFVNGISNYVCYNNEFKSNLSRAVYEISHPN